MALGFRLTALGRHAPILCALASPQWRWYAQASSTLNDYIGKPPRVYSRPRFSACFFEVSRHIARDEYGEFTFWGFRSRRLRYFKARSLARKVSYIPSPIRRRHLCCFLACCGGAPMGFFVNSRHVLKRAHISRAAEGVSTGQYNILQVAYFMSAILPMLYRCRYGRRPWDEWLPPIDELFDFTWLPISNDRLLEWAKVYAFISPAHTLPYLKVAVF